MRESMYVDEYLEDNNRLGLGRGRTVGTFLSYVLRGTAREYSGKYQRALENALERRVRDGRAFVGASAMGRTAYYSL